MTTATGINGLSLEAVQGMVDLVKGQPAVVQATFYATTDWKGGFHNEAAIQTFALGGAKNDTSRAQRFTILGDHPQELLGTSEGPTSVELRLAALGHCLASGWATYGAVLGVAIESLRIDVAGDIDLQGMLTLPGVVAPGFQAIRATYYVRSAAAWDQLEQLARMSEDLSPTRHSLRAVDFSFRLIVEG